MMKFFARIIAILVSCSTSKAFYTQKPLQLTPFLTYSSTYPSLECKDAKLSSSSSCTPDPINMFFASPSVPENFDLSNSAPKTKTKGDRQSQAAKLNEPVEVNVKDHPEVKISKNSVIADSTMIPTQKKLQHLGERTSLRPFRRPSKSVKDTARFKPEEIHLRLSPPILNQRRKAAEANVKVKPYIARAPSKAANINAPVNPPMQNKHHEAPDVMLNTKVTSPIMNKRHKAPDAGTLLNPPMLNKGHRAPDMMLNTKVTSPIMNEKRKAPDTGTLLNPPMLNKGHRAPDTGTLLNPPMLNKGHKAPDVMLKTKVPPPVLNINNKITDTSGNQPTKAAEIHIPMTPPIINNRRKPPGVGAKVKSDLKLASKLKEVNISISPPKLRNGCKSPDIHAKIKNLEVNRAIKCEEVIVPISPPKLNNCLKSPDIGARVKPSVKPLKTKLKIYETGTHVKPDQVKVD